MAEWNDRVKAGEEGPDALLDMQEFFYDIWARERVDEAIGRHAKHQFEDALKYGVEKDDFDLDVREAYSECWWEPLVEWMRIGTDIKVGDLMTSAWHDESIIMLMSHPEDECDECWLMNGRLLSTHELIKADADEWWEPGTGSAW